MNYNHVINHRGSGKLFFSIFIFFALVQSILAVSFFGENFNSIWSTTNPPTGWRIAFTGDTATNDWHRKDALASPWFNNLTSYACLFGDPITGDAPDSLISPIINCSNYHNIVLRCSTYFAPLSGFYRAALYGSIDGGATWTYEIGNYTNQIIPPQLLTDELPWALNQTQVRFLWVYEGDPHALAYWCIDDFSLIGSAIGVEEERSLQSSNLLSLQIYPNPAKLYLAIRLPSIAYRQMIKIFDVSGKMIREIATLPSAFASQSIGTRSALRNDNEMKISLKRINPGIYFLRFGKETKKFLVVK